MVLQDTAYVLSIWLGVTVVVGGGIYALTQGTGAAVAIAVVPLVSVFTLVYTLLWVVDERYTPDVAD